MKSSIAIILMFFLITASLTSCIEPTDPTETNPVETKENTQNEATQESVDHDPVDTSKTKDSSHEENKTTKTEKIEITDEFKITEERPEASNQGASIKLSTFDIQGDMTVKIKALKEPPLDGFEAMDEDFVASVYDFTLLEQETFIDLIEIRLPYDPSIIDPEADEENCAFGLYYNPKNKHWESVDYSVDTLTKEVIITTDHLSTYGVFTVRNENTRLAYIARVNPYKKLVDSQMAQEIISEAISQPKSQNQKAMALGMGITNDWLGLSGFLLTTSSPVYTSDFLKGFGDVFNGLGIAAAALQVAVDFQSGDDIALYGNLSKNIMNILVSNWGSSALQLSFAGVFAIDYSLNKFATAAWDGRNEIWYSAYNLHYQEKMQLRPKEWYSKFYWIWQDSLEKEDPNYLKNEIQRVMDENLKAFWQNESEMAFYQSEVMSQGVTGGGGLNDKLIKEITDVKRAELAKSLQPVFNQLERKITYYLRDDYRKKLEAMKAQMNQVIHVSIQEIITENGKAQYADYIVKFAPLNDAADEKTWIGRLKDDGSIQTKFTLLGHMQSGQPNTLEIYEPKANLESDKPVKVIPFMISGDNLTITFGEAPPLEALVGPWPGNFFFKSVKVPSPESLESSSAEDTPESCDGFDIDMASILESIKEQEGQTQPAVINIAQVDNYSGYLYFGDDTEGLEENEKLYFNYANGEISLSKSEDGFNLTVNLRAGYVQDERILLEGPIKITGMNNTLDIDIDFKGER